jgi:hypothetical protein
MELEEPESATQETTTNKTVNNKRLRHVMAGWFDGHNSHTGWPLLSEHLFVPAAIGSLLVHALPF